MNNNQEAEKGQEGEVWEKVSSFIGDCLFERHPSTGRIVEGLKLLLSPATPQPVTGEYKYQALWSYGQGSDWTDCTKEEYMNEPEDKRRIVEVIKPRPSDAVEFANNLLLDGHIQMVEQAANYTIEQLYKLFKQ